MSDNIESAGWNPRYVVYARAHGLTPEAMRDHDREAWPGGRAAGFILWFSRMREEAKVEIPKAFFDGRICDHAAFDGWLDARLRRCAS
jgi:hypothetical protein